MWNRREVFGVLGAGAAGLTLMAHRSEAGDDAPAQAAGKHTGDGTRHSAVLKECYDACDRCEEACSEAFHHCIAQAAAGKAEHAKMAQLVIDCAAFCTLSATMIARHSSLMAESCRACGEACRRCAEECGTSADGMMKACAAACKRCEESCREMVKTMGGEHHH